MKLRNLTFGILVAAAAFTLGTSAYAAVGFALSFVPGMTARSEVYERTSPKSEPAQAQPIPTKPIFTEPSTASEANDMDQPVEEFDWGGYYYLNSETVPKAFSDIDYFDLRTREYVHDADKNLVDFAIVPIGSIRANKEMKFTRIAIGGKEIAFQTAAVDGVSYKFTGRFLNEGYCDTGDDKPVLKGRLIKIKNNKWAAEMEAEFYVTCGC